MCRYTGFQTINTQMRSLIASINEINSQNLAYHRITPIDKLHMNRILQSIVISVLLVLECDDEDVSQPILFNSLVPRTFVLEVSLPEAPALNCRDLQHMISGRACLF